MQVVYSGGSATPNPSPRVQRKTGYGRPVLPGYMTHTQPSVLNHRSGEKLTEGDITLRDSIPAMSKGVAVLCLVLNIILPGCGTLTAGLSVLCCSHVRPKGDSKGHCIWVNAGVALLQFGLTFLCLLGWIWSIMWGVGFLSVSKRYYRRHEERHDRAKLQGGDKHELKETNSSGRHEHRTSHGSGEDAERAHTHLQPPPTRHHHRTRHQDHQHREHRQHQQQQQRDSQHRHRDDQYEDYSTDPNEGEIYAQEVREKENNSMPVSCVDHKDIDNQIDFVSLSKQPSPTVNNAATPPKLSNNFRNSNSVSHSDTAEDVQKAATPTAPPTAPSQPIIVLGRANHSVYNGGTVNSGPEETILKARTRHQKILQRKMSDNDLSPFSLTHQQLEAIVIHDFPVHAPLHGGGETEGRALPKP